MKSIACSLTLCLISTMAAPSQADPLPYIIPILNEMPVTHNSGHTVESATTAPKWSWHSKANLQWSYPVALADRASQLRTDILVGFGLPGRLELHITIPFGITMGSPLPAQTNPYTVLYRQMDYPGAGLGDIRMGFMWNAKPTQNGGLEILLGFNGYMPTGHHGKLLGEGDFSAQPWFSLALSVLSARITFNLAYRIRHSHVATISDTQRFEQDDDLIWKIAVRIPKEDDIAWSIESQGAIGVATHEGGWPNSDSRPVWLGGGIDFPAGTHHRFGVMAGFGVTGSALSTFTVGLRVTQLPRRSDDDKDGILDINDKCPLLPEDIDGYMDSDGCPDMDNDKDGFPDDEDECPLKPGDDFSDTGC